MYEYFENVMSQPLFRKSRLLRPNTFLFTICLICHNGLKSINYLKAFAKIKAVIIKNIRLNRKMACLMIKSIETKNKQIYYLDTLWLKLEKHQTTQFAFDEVQTQTSE